MSIKVEGLNQFFLQGHGRACFAPIQLELEDKTFNKTNTSMEKRCLVANSRLHPFLSFSASLVSLCLFGFLSLGFCDVYLSIFVLSVVSFEAMQLRGTSKVVTLGFGLCRA